MKIIAMVPARQGSKGLPDKNITNLLGKPLISYSILSTLKCEKINSVYINSDSDKYLEIGEKLGAKRYKRPIKLAKDQTSMKDVLIDFSKFLIDNQIDFDAIMTLYPTNPLRTLDFIDEFIDKFVSIGGNRPFISIKKPLTHPSLCYSRDYKGNLSSILNINENIYYRRQEYPEYFCLAGGNYIIPIEYLNKINAQLICKETYGYILPENTVYVDVDAKADLELAEYYLQKSIVN